MVTHVWFRRNYLLFPLKWELCLYQQSWLHFDNFKNLISATSLKSSSHMILSPRNLNFYSFPKVILLSVICDSFPSVFCFYTLQSQQNYVVFTINSWKNLIFVLLLIIFPIPWLQRWTKIFLNFFFLSTFFYTHSQTWKIGRKKIWLLIMVNTLKGLWKCMLFKRCYFSLAS